MFSFWRKKFFESVSQQGGAKSARWWSSADRDVPLPLQMECVELEDRVLYSAVPLPVDVMESPSDDMPEIEIEFLNDVESNWDQSHGESAL